MRLNTTKGIAFATFCVLILVAGAFAYFNTSSKPDVLKPIRFAGRDQVLANWLAIIAQENGYCNDEGVAIEFQTVGRGRDAAQALISGQADITTMSEFSFMLASHHYKDMRIFGSIAQSSNSVILLGDAFLGVRKIQDIAGKNVALSLGSGSQFYVEDLLSQLRIPIKSVQIVNFEPQSLVSAASRHEVAVMAAWQPYSHQIEEILGTNAILLRVPQTIESYDMSFDLVAHKSFLKDRNEQVNCFVKALRRAQDFLLKYPLQSINIYSKRTGLSSEVVTRMMADYTFILNLPRDRILATLNREDIWAMHSGLIQQSFSHEELNSLIDSDFIQN